MIYSVDVSDLQRINKKFNHLNKVIESGKELKILFDYLGAALVATTIRDIFSKEQDPDGVEWKTLSRVTIARRIGRFSPRYRKKIVRRAKETGSPVARRLQDTGRLRNSIGKILKSFSIKPEGDNLGKGEPESIVNFEKYSLEIGTSVPYAKKHNEGEGRIPQRRFLGLGRIYLERLPKLLQTFVTRFLKRNWENQ